MERRKLLDILAQLNPSGLTKIRSGAEEDPNELKSRVQDRVDDFEKHDENIKRKIDKLDEDKGDIPA